MYGCVSVVSVYVSVTGCACGLWAVGCGLWAVRCNPWGMGCGLWHRGRGRDNGWGGEDGSYSWSCPVPARAVPHQAADGAHCKRATGIVENAPGAAGKI